jgi:large subunit ribosomal protein L13
MKIVIDGKDAILGRLASYAAKLALKGEEVIVVNCSEIIITGRKEKIVQKFEERRKRVGTTQQGPRFPRTDEKIVKRTIRGMLPDHREGRGKIAYKRIKCYSGIPKEFENSEKISLQRKLRNRFVKIGKISKCKK